MADHPKTVRVKPWGEDQGDFVEINEEDFDETKHELFEEEPAKRGPGRPKKIADAG